MLGYLSSLSIPVMPYGQMGSYRIINEKMFAFSMYISVSIEAAPGSEAFPLAYLHSLDGDCCRHIALVSRAQQAAVMQEYQAGLDPLTLGWIIQDTISMINSCTDASEALLIAAARAVHLSEYCWADSPEEVAETREEFAEIQRIFTQGKYN